ncbi:hypothetical protein [Mycoplasma sp. CSL10166]|uniref:hypothetical protein n=1 Tax=Mycoplasma sp. CSL10166 TaxID=2813825 RepID=UPI00197C340D|nr:hypothetical protein [Mycoplasma sp. CSL10166]MBN4084662.1 hypothetical protein [Mycoplasma sp. CSL10166]
MKKTKKWFILGTLMLSVGVSPTLVSCSENKYVKHSNSKIKEKDKNNEIKINNKNNVLVPQDNKLEKNKINDSINDSKNSNQSNSISKSKDKNIDNSNKNDTNNTLLKIQDTNKTQTINDNLIIENEESVKETPKVIDDGKSIPNIYDVDVQNLNSNIIKFSNSNNDINIEQTNPNFYSGELRNIINFYKSYAVTKDVEFDNLKSHEKQLKGQFTQQEKTIKNIGEFSMEFNDSNKQLTLNFENEISVDEIDIMIKSTNYLMPFAKVFKSEKSDSKKVFKFNLKTLPKHINNFIVTSYSTSTDSYSLNFYPKYIFTNNNKVDNIKVEDFKVFKENNKLYGSLKINLNESNKEYFAQKTFALSFSPILKNSNETFKRKKLFPSRTIYIRISELDKFELNKLFKNVEYKLDNIKILEGDSKVESFIKINIDKIKDNSFSDNSKIANYNDNYFVERINLISKNKVDYTYKNDEELSKLVDSQLDTYFNFTFENSFDRYDYNYERQNLNIIKNNEIYKLVPFLGKDYIRNNYFKISENNTKAILEKDLSLYEFKELDPSKIIVTFAFEFDPYQTNPRHFSEVQKARSIIKMSYPLSKLTNYTKITNPHLDITYINENKDVSKSVLNYIHKNFNFTLDINRKINTSNTTNNLNLKLTISSKNNFNYQAKIYEIASQHNDDPKESAFIGNNYFFIHRFQRQNDNISNYISYAPKKIDKLSNNTITKANLNNSYYPNIDFKIKNTNPEKFATRLTKEDNSIGANNIRSRAFALGSDGGGSWSVIGKTNNKDHRYYVMTNSHVTAPIIADEMNNFINNLFKFSYYRNRGFDSILVPTILSKSEIEQNPQKPYFTQEAIYGLDEKNGLNRLWFSNQKFKRDDYLGASNIENLYVFDKNKEQARFYDEILGRVKIPADEQISFKMIKDYRIKDEKGRNGKKINEKLYYLHGEQLDDEGNILLNNDENNNMDFSIAEIDFSFFFNHFENQKGKENYIFDGYTLKKNEKAVVDFILNLDNLKPLKISNEVYHYNDYSSLNWYLGSFPMENSANSASYGRTRRYREYLITNIPEATHYSSPVTWGNYFARVFNLKQNSVDLEAGSSGTGVFDVKGDLVGVINSGSSLEPGLSVNDRFITFLMFDTQKISFFGDVRNLNNPNSFVAETKKLAYLYPDLYDDIYEDISYLDENKNTKS